MPLNLNIPKNNIAITVGDTNNINRIATNIVRPVDTYVARM